ncbi:MAG: Alpha-L-arabinofuranosidase precursor [Phenylobacterium sp.]|nr:Alpha-L-arabinofuranosidase precursor [Phenylobacterium sp.]
MASPLPFRLALCAAAAVVLFPAQGLTQTPRAASDAPQDALEAGFRSPPNVAKPRAWWHWMNGNVTPSGIKADLEWMNRVGIGGAHYFDAGGILANYQFITPRVVVGDANWQADIRLAASTADRLGMELTTAASPGWSETGGPWVTPAQAMKKYVWSETLVEGGRAFRGTLAHPPTTTGGFQTAPSQDSLALVTADTGKNESFYADALVVAYRLPQGEVAALPPGQFTASSSPAELARLGDGDLARTVQLVGAADGSPPWIQVAYATPQTVRGLWLGVAGLGASGGPVKPQLLVSDDGQAWRVGATLTGPADAILKSYGFAPLTARFFRLTLPATPRTPVPVGMPDFAPPARPVKVAVSEFALQGGATVDRLVEKAGFSDPIDYAAAPTAPVTPDAVIRKGDVVDLTARLRPDGSLDWTPPAGRWRVIRLGYSLTGTKNHPAPVEATGLEVDKFSRKHVADYIEAYLGRFEAAAGKDLVGSRGLQNLLSDSWEAGVQNWTDDMPAEFRRRRGYDLTPWLPVLAGHVVESSEASDKFLWDFRRTLEDLLSQHYAVIAEALKRRGMGFYSEAQGDGWRAIGDGMEMKRHADIPMAEYWYRPFAAGPGQPTLKADMKESASVAHIYGKPLVANESLTVFAARDPWGFSPEMLKPVVDEIFAHGVNRIVLHTSAHQPSDDKKPGLALGPFGQYLNRHETWAEQSGPFLSYIARSSYLLQQGRFVADVAYFYGEDRPLVSLFAGQFDEAAGRLRIETPEGYGYDFINAEALREETSVQDGRLTTRAGMSYRVLYMRPDARALTLPTIRKLQALVEAGAVLAGDPPHGALGLGASDAEIRAVADQIWGPAPPASGERAVGKGRVYWGRPLAEVLAAERVAPDVSFAGGQPDSYVMQLHRRTADADIYFLTNRKDRPERLEASFRAAGRTAELWRADSGRIEAASYRTAGDRTVVPLELGPNEAVFVVFRRVATSAVFTAPALKTVDLGGVKGPWRLSFPPGLGAPPELALPALASWSESADPGVKYFSGTATYATTFEVGPRALRPGARLMLDLGSVKEIAEVLVNGKPAGIAWKAPYVVDITGAAKPGRNSLAVKVTNLWANRLIGDAQPGVTHKFTWTALDALPPSDILVQLTGWRVNSKLPPSGLLGPVSLESIGP